MRHRYALDLSRRAAPEGEGLGLSFATFKPEDLDAVAALMLDAYRATIDDEGETLVESRAAIREFLSGSPLPACSWVCREGAEPVSACLVGIAPPSPDPLVYYVMTRADRKGSGLARLVLERSLASLALSGYARAWAVVTEGNLPSERLLDRQGFRRIPEVRVRAEG